MTVKVLWLNGDKEVVNCRTVRVRDGLLIMEIQRDEWRYIPLTSLRDWTEVRS